MKIIIIFLIFLLYYTTVVVSSDSGSQTNTGKREYQNRLAVNTGNGLIGHYYQNYLIDSSGVISFNSLTESFNRIDTTINFWNGDRYFRWQPVSGWGDRYSVHWTGYIFIEASGDYGFGTISDDGSQVSIDSIMIVNNSELQWFDWEDNISEGDTSGTPFPILTLDSGFHTISVRFYENASYDGIELWWFKADNDSSDVPYYGTNFHGSPPTYNPQTNWEIIPKQVLYTEIDTLTSIDLTGETDHLPEVIKLKQNYPNPCNPMTTIEFDILEPGFVSLKVYDVLGKEISTLVNKQLSQGTHKVEWKSENLSSGLYFYKLETKGYSKTKKLILIK